MRLPFKLGDTIITDELNNTSLIYGIGYERFKGEKMNEWYLVEAPITAPSSEVFKITDEFFLDALTYQYDLAYDLLDPNKAYVWLGNEYLRYQVENILEIMKKEIETSSSSDLSPQLSNNKI